MLINITGGMDLTIDEVTTIASIIQEAAGDDAEIIFGAVHDPTMEGEVRVTAIATGLAQEEEPIRDNIIRPNFQARVAPVGMAASMPAPMPAGAGSAVRGALTAEAMPFPRPPERPIVRQQLTDLDIPTFIRRQMD